MNYIWSLKEKNAQIDHIFLQVTFAIFIIVY